MRALTWVGVPLVGAALIVVSALVTEPDTLGGGWPLWLAYGIGVLLVAGWGIVAATTAFLRRVTWRLPVAMAGLGAGFFTLGVRWTAPIADAPYIFHPVIAVNLLGAGLVFGLSSVHSVS